MTSQEEKSRIADSHNRMGMCYARLGDHARARREFEAAISIDPKSADGYCNLGNTLRELGELDGAVSSYDRVLEIDPGRFDARLNLISTLRERHGVSWSAFGAGATADYPRFGEREAHARVARPLRKSRADDHAFPRGVRVVGYCLAAVIICVALVLWILRR
ncbi:MAG: tetratricopeptide repeat protein [Bacillota bacterium]